MWRWFRWVLLSIAIILVIIVIVFFTFIKPSKKESANISIPVYQDPQCSRNFSPQFNAGPYYQGALFDTHFHLPPEHGNDFGKFGVILEKNLTLKDIICEFEKEKVTGAITFHAPNGWLMVSNTPEDTIINQWIEQMKEIKKGLPEWTYLFYDPISGYDNEAQKVYNSTKGTINGFGELVYIKGETPRPGAEIDDQVSLEIFKLAGDHNLPVMVHPEEKDITRFENALKQNPNTIFILHGWENDSNVMDLINKYPNLYFTLDATTLSYDAGRFIEGPKDKFIETLKNKFSTNLDNSVRQWGRRIEKHPDRFLWGTDRCFDFHYSEEVGKLYEEFARAFIGRLDPIYQEMVAYKNAKDIFDKGLQPQIQTNQNSNNQNNNKNK